MSAGEQTNTSVTREWLAAQMDPAAFDPRLDSVHPGQPRDRVRRQQDALAHAATALRLLESDAEHRSDPTSPWNWPDHTRDTVPTPRATSVPSSQTGYDKAAERRQQVAHARARADILRSAAAAGEQKATDSAWPERGRAAATACRTLAAYLTHHPTDPVALHLVAGLATDQPERRMPK
jgi:hypothetical protein